MKFRFELDVKKIPWPVHHRHKLLLIGSCFTENIGEKLRTQKFGVLENPHGIVFNPVSVAESITDTLQNQVYTADDLFYYNEAFHSWKHHSRFSGLSAADSLQKINASNTQAHSFLKEADYLFITLGSAWTYRLTGQALHATTGRVAANNHKAPAAWFQRVLLSVRETVDALQTAIDSAVQLNPHLKLILTISPVRHLREGAVDNNRSKAVLIQAVHELITNFENAYYFPAYELVIDDLRDYRFYAEDLVHPNYAATQYVWEKFTASCMPADTQKLIEELTQLRLAFNHKPFNASSLQHQKFLQTYLGKTKLLWEQYPYLDFSDELRYFAGEASIG